MNKQSIVNNILQKMKDNKSKKLAVIGYDGFVDEIIRVVNTRTSFDTFSTILKIENFATKIAKAAGKSANIELVSEHIKIGGNGPILANALLKQGHDVFYIGAIGFPEIHPVFTTFANHCKGYISIANPGHTDALEFDDGKLMLGKITSLEQIHWQKIQAELRLHQQKEAILNAALYAITNWTMLPSLDSVLEGWSEIFSTSQRKPFVFIDLADPAKRTQNDILAMTKILTKLAKNSQCILGLNENESILLSQVLSLSEKNSTKRAQQIREKVNLSAVIIHPKEGAVIATQKNKYEIKGPYTSKPKISTGAGDNFNGGFCTGLLAGLTYEECLYTGVCTSGYYVRNAKSPSKKELLSFMKTWSDNSFEQC